MRITLIQFPSVAAIRLKPLGTVCISLLALIVALSMNWRLTLNAETASSTTETVTGQQISATTNSPTVVTIRGRQILVSGAPFTIGGVGYAPTPIGDDPETTPPYGDYFTSGYSAIYNRDLPLLRQMGANTIRLWGWKYDANHTDFLDQAYNNGVSPIYVIVSFWVDKSRNISDPAVRDAITAEFKQMVAIHKNYPAVLMWAIGNELNAPWMFGDSDDLFRLIDEMAQAAHEEEGPNYHPVTTPLANVNNQWIGTIKGRDPQVPNLDVWSVQVYQGSSFGSLFSDYAVASCKPLVITEYGIDAYDDRNGDEYENIGPPYQAIYAESLWNEIVTNSNVCSGGSIMAYSDEWWKGKYGQTDSNHPNCPDHDPAYHSACGYPIASHPDGYSNEEWWGVMRIRDNGLNADTMQPRAVYYTLQSLWTNRVYLPLYVNGATGSDTTDCTNPVSPCATIGYALGLAGDGDTILVAQGTYTENLVITKTVTLKGGYEPVYWSRCLRRCTTTVAGDQSASVINVQSTLSKTTVIDGFTITNYTNSVGISTLLSSVAIQNSNIIRNHPGWGGGINLDHSFVTITNTLVADNHGGVNIISTISIPGPVSDVTITNSTIANNGAPDRYGIFCSLSACKVINSIVWGHQGRDFGGLGYSATYSDIEMGLPGTGNISEDPHFVDPANGDYHLRSGSSCIDAGTNDSAPKTDFEGDPRPVDGDGDGIAITDMGADEFLYPICYKIYLPIIFKNVSL